MERQLRRSHATGLRWVALSLVGLGVAAACSDDSMDPGKGPAGGGEGGENAAGSPTVPNAGKATGGNAGNGTGGAGGAGGGEGGAGGVPHVATLGEQCTTCAASECTGTLKSCSDSAECGAWLACVTTCETAECVADCDAANVDAARVYSAVYECMCTSCKADCTAAGACAKKTCVDDSPLAVAALAPATLAETGLYATVEGSGVGGAGGAGGAAGVELVEPIAIASYVRSFEPKYPLWADGATKDRYVYVPKCETIDTSDMDHWKFPVGTRFWKTFTAKSTVGAIDTVVETRLMHRFGPGVLDWTYATYQWDVNKPGDPAAATLVADTGLPNANGTSHDIPSIGQCKQCHNGLEEKVLGFGAFQLSHDTTGADLTIKQLSELGWLTTPAPDGFEVPGTPVEQAALGYMHGNCGSCHSEKTPIPAGSPQLLRLMVAQSTIANTDAVKTTVDIPVLSGNAAIAGMDRIEPTDPDHSALLIRMAQRTAAGLQMPPLGTKVADTDGGVKAVTDWINSLPK